MLTLLFYLTLHCLFWGAVGAVLAQRVGFSRWLGALISIVLPVIGAVILLVIGSRRDESPVGPVAKQWRDWGWVGVAGGVAIVAASWLSWPGASVDAEAQEREILDFGLDLADLEQLALVGTITGLAIAGCSYAVVRTGRRGWAITGAALAWLPAFTAGLLILSEGFIDHVGEQAEHAANTVQVAQVANARVDADYSIGVGPYVCLLGAVSVLCWVAYWSMRAPAQTSLQPAQGWVPAPSSSAPSNWLPEAQPTDADTWIDWSTGESKPASDNRSEWEW